MTFDYERWGINIENAILIMREREKCNIINVDCRVTLKL